MVNFFSGNTLNRLSWKRPDSRFINNCLQKDSLWIVFNNGQPLVKSLNGRSTGLAYISIDRVRHFLGREPYFGQGETTGELAASEVAQLESARINNPRVVFLGTSIPENKSAREVRDLIERNGTDQYSSYFTFDISGLDSSQRDLESLLRRTADQEEALEFIEPRAAMATFSAFDAGLFAQARSIVDWNLRNKFCPACGQASYSLWAGWKLACTTNLPWKAPQSGTVLCPSSKGLQNFMHPRTDAVIIVAVISEDDERILLGHNKRSPQAMYSTLAGFLEPGESLEEAVQREVMEESGVMIKNVQYHSTQPWPFPANLMLGCFAVAENESIQILDDELEDVRFFTRKEVQDVLRHPQGTNIQRSQLTRLDGDASVATDPGPHFRVPPATSIAGVLISDWAFNRVSLRSNL